MSDVATAAQAEARVEGEVMVVRLSGDWQMTAERPRWNDVAAQAAGEVSAVRPKCIRVEDAGIGTWDSSLALIVHEAQITAASIGAKFEGAGLPAGVARIVGVLSDKTPLPTLQHGGIPNLFAFVGTATTDLWRELRDIARLIGECAFSVARFFRGYAQFRWRDCLTEMQHCGAMALPIVGLISFLVGVILAYQGAVQLRTFGADIYVADMVGVAVVREMGPLMAAIVLAGRTGAAFAATLGNMKANEEIDALETLGISPIDFLVMPRMIALLMMMPLLALYSNLLGMFGGWVIAASILDIPASLYWAETKTIVDLSDLFTGLIKAAAFGILIGISGCLRGLQADRSAAGVGQAATRAVVTGILLIIVSDAIFAVIFNILGW